MDIPVGMKHVLPANPLGRSHISRGAERTIDPRSMDDNARDRLGCAEKRLSILFFGSCDECDEGYIYLHYLQKESKRHHFSEKKDTASNFVSFFFSIIMLVFGVHIYLHDKWENFQSNGGESRTFSVEWIHHGVLDLMAFFRLGNCSNQQ